MEFSKFDQDAIDKIRANVDLTISISALFDDVEDNLVLDIAPQDHKGAKHFFKNAKVETMDINPDSGADYIADLCNRSANSPESEKFDVIICTEVLEHTRNPFKAVDEIYRMLKYGGWAYITTPFNFRIHGPSPDMWRFTRFALAELFKDFKEVAIDEFPTIDRPNMPIAYSVMARKINLEEALDNGLESLESNNKISGRDYLVDL